jgi:hypothetical protein
VGGCSTPCPCGFTPGKEDLYPFYRRLVGPRAVLNTFMYLPFLSNLFVIISFTDIRVYHFVEVFS